MKRNLLAYLLCIQFSVFSQNNQETPKAIFGAGIEMYYSVNGHGAFYSPHLSYAKSKHHLKLGPAIHKRSLNVTGAKLSYSYLLAGMDAEEQFNANFKENNNGAWRVSIFAYAQYSHSTPLSYQRADEESLLNADTTINWNQIRINTGEIGFGVELDIKVLHRLQIRTYVGVTAYNHFNQPIRMYQDKSAATFIAGAGVNIPSFKK